MSDRKTHENTILTKVNIGKSQDHKYYKNKVIHNARYYVDIS